VEKSMKESGRHTSGCTEIVVTRYSPTNDTTDQQHTCNWRMIALKNNEPHCTNIKDSSKETWQKVLKDD